VTLPALALLFVEPGCGQDLIEADGPQLEDSEGDEGFGGDDDTESGDGNDDPLPANPEPDEGDEETGPGPSEGPETEPSDDPGDEPEDTEGEPANESESDSGQDVEGGCEDAITFVVGAEEARLEGWTSFDAGLYGFNEGLVIAPFDPQGSAVFEIPIECQDEWFIWVRAFDGGTDDSFFVQVDGAPNPGLIHETDCTGAGNVFRWTPLNQRASDAPVCNYLTYPWRQEWEAGTHEVSFAQREQNVSIAALLITNDPELVP
jgi:hypothetical protein